MPVWCYFTPIPHDALNRSTEKKADPDGLGLVSLRTLGYDVMDNLTSVSDADSELAFVYDLLDQLDTASTASAPLQPSVLMDY